MKAPVVAVFAGGSSAEREVSLGSGLACALGLARSHPTRLYNITHDALPEDLNPRAQVVFSMLHGTFGEDGGMQRLLEEAGVEYAGCDSVGSALTMDKALTKQRVAAAGVPVPAAMVFDAGNIPPVEAILDKLGGSLVVKPNAEGSSVGLSLVESREELSMALSAIKGGRWLVEQRVIGRELSVGVLGGEAMGVVEIRPKSGVYDYTSKYTVGRTEYFVPAPIGEEMTVRACRAAETAFRVCGCRDYARVDFILSEASGLYLLEINSLPGMKETSLLPMSARCAGLDFAALVRELVSPAIQRFYQRQSIDES